jgi:hypothetical protein
MTYPPTWKWLKHGKVLEGTYMGVFPAVGKGGRSVLYAIKDKSGKTWTIWGVNEVKQALQLRPFGKKVRFEYLGMKKTKKGFMSMHFKINVGRGKADADPTNIRGPLKKRTKLAARHTSPLQSLPRPVMTVGSDRDHASAAKKRSKIKIKYMIPQPPIPQPPALPPVPIPPIGYSAAPSFKENWLQRIKKL